jgi:drug/metabolite transporter (DMT)-like permease
VLSRLILKENLGAQHILALAHTLVGVLLISKPTFLFSSPTQHTPVLFMLNSTDASKSLDTASENSSRVEFIIGVVCVLVSAFFFGMQHVVVKKLCNYKIKWFVITIYDSYFGLPLAILASCVIFEFKIFDTKDFSNIQLSSILTQLFYSAISAVCCLVGQIAINLSLTYENPTKVSIIKASDTVVAFILQLIILNVEIDVLSLLGSLSILTGVLIVLIFKLADQSISKSDHVSDKKSLFLKFYLFKF